MPIPGQDQHWHRQGGGARDAGQPAGCQDLNPGESHHWDRKVRRNHKTQEKKIQYAIVLANNTHTHLGPLEQKKVLQKVQPP